MIGCFLGARSLSSEKIRSEAGGWPGFSERYTVCSRLNQQIIYGGRNLDSRGNKKVCSQGIYTGFSEGYTPEGEAGDQMKSHSQRVVILVKTHDHLSTEVISETSRNE